MLIISEPFNYTIFGNNPDPDASSGRADGLPARLWVNPVLGSPLGTPNTTLTTTANFIFSSVTTRANVANAMTFDEFRLGTTYAAGTTSEAAL